MYKCKKTSSKRKNAKFIIRAINNTQFNHGGVDNFTFRAK